MADSHAPVATGRPASARAKPGAGWHAILTGAPGRYAPAVIVAVSFTTMLHRSGVGYVSVLQFLAVQALAFTLPGTLLWRALRGGRDPGAVDVVMGTIAFHALSVPWYIALRWTDAPQLTWALPAAAVGAALVAGRRRGLTPWSSRRLPPWCSWNAGAAVSLGVIQIGQLLPVASGEPIRWPGTDTPFLLSLAGELKHHMPARIPFVTGQQLDYHWFTFADLANTSWLGGQELDVLTFSLMPLGLLTLGLAGFGLVGWRFSGHPAGGVVALWLAVLVGTAMPLGGFDGYIVDSTFLAVIWTGSVTQAYVEVLATAILYVVIDLVRTGGPRSSWTIFAVATFVASGAKASSTPVLGAGALAAVAPAYRRGGRWVTVLTLGVILAAELVFARIVLFGGVSQGLSFGPRASVDQIAQWLHFGRLDDGQLSLVALFLVVCWSLPLVVLGASFLPSERRRVGGDMASWWILGMVTGSIMLTLVTTHPGFSQYTFLRAGLPFGYIGVAACLVRLWDLTKPSVRLIAVAAAPLGLATCLILRASSEPTALPRSLSQMLQVLLATALAIALVAAIAARLAKPGGRAVAALLVAGVFSLGIGATRTVDNISRLDEPLFDATDPGPAVIPAGGIAAARYVRAHSSPDNLFATNAHCRLPDQPVCKNTGHWMSAWTERRAVVEGWGYTPRANASGDSIPAITTSPFWDPALLTLNDKVFLEPSRGSLDKLLDRFPVRWLIVDRRFPADLPGLRTLLPAHREFDDTVVFDVRSLR